MLNALREVEKGVEIDLWAVPNADTTALVGYDEWKGCIRFKTTAPALKDKANKAVIEFFEALLGGKVELVKGAKSRKKTLLVLGATPGEVSDRLNRSLKT